MVDWKAIKIQVSKAKPKPVNPFDLDGPIIPTSKKIDIIVESEQYDIALTDLLERMFSSIDEELTDEVLKNIRRSTSKKYPEQFLLLYRGFILGLVFVHRDMFSTFLRFRSEIKNFKEIKAIEI